MKNEGVVTAMISEYPFKYNQYASFLLCLFLSPNIKHLFNLRRNTQNHHNLLYLVNCNLKINISQIKLKPAITRGVHKVCGPTMMEQRYKGHWMHENTIIQCKTSLNLNKMYASMSALYYAENTITIDIAILVMWSTIQYKGNWMRLSQN